MALLWIVGVVAMTLGSVRVARHKADTAADLAALGAAAKVMAGQETACQAAAEVVKGSGGRLAACAVRGRIAEVSVVMAVRAPFGTPALRIVSRARAGPAGPEGVPLSSDSRCTGCQ